MPMAIAFRTAGSVHTDPSLKFIFRKKHLDVEICEKVKLSFSNIG